MITGILYAQNISQFLLSCFQGSVDQGVSLLSLATNIKSALEAEKLLTKNEHLTDVTLITSLAVKAVIFCNILQNLLSTLSCFIVF